MNWAKVMTGLIGALVWGNLAFADLSPKAFVSEDDVRTRISGLMEHFASKHPDLNVHVRDVFEAHMNNEHVAERVLQDLTALDIVIEHNQQEPEEHSLISITCNRALCFGKGNGLTELLTRPIRVACPQAECQ